MGAALLLVAGLPAPLRPGGIAIALTLAFFFLRYQRAGEIVQAVTVGRPQGNRAAQYSGCLAAVLEYADDEKALRESIGTWVDSNPFTGAPVILEASPGNLSLAWRNGVFARL